MSRLLSRRAFLLTATSVASATLVWTCIGSRSSSTQRSSSIAFENYVDRDGWMMSPADPELAATKTDTPPGRP